MAHACPVYLSWMFCIMIEDAHCWCGERSFLLCNWNSSYHITLITLMSPGNENKLALFHTHLFIFIFIHKPALYTTFSYSVLIHFYWHLYFIPTESMSVSICSHFWPKVNKMHQFFSWFYLSWRNPDSIEDKPAWIWPGRSSEDMAESDFKTVPSPAF